jgi:hypothetical protein
MCRQMGHVAIMNGVRIRQETFIAISVENGSPSRHRFRWKNYNIMNFI